MGLKFSEITEIVMVFQKLFRGFILSASSDNDKHMLMRQKKWDMNKSERTERLPCEYKMFRCPRCTAITEYCWEWLHKCNNYPHTVKEETCVTMRLGSNPGVDAICGLSLSLVLSLSGSERFFSRYSGFPLSSKTNTSKFQFDQEW